MLAFVHTSFAAGYLAAATAAGMFLSTRVWLAYQADQQRARVLFGSS